jgi:lipoprotein-anchoring transpeptidase ErfK/SrfK
MFAMLAAAAPEAEAQRSRQQAAQPAIQRQPNGPVVAVVSIGEQRINLFDRDGLVASSPISSGRSGYATPEGVFSILEKREEHYSNLYDDAPMPFMQRLTWSGVALHAGALPGYPASHGCIRLPHAFSERLFQMTERGTRVVVTPGSPRPVAFSHPALFKPLLDGEPVQVAAAAETAPLPRRSATMARLAEGMMRLGGAHAETSPPAPAAAAPTPVQPRIGSLEALRAEAATLLTTAQREARRAKAAVDEKVKANAAVVRRMAAARLARDRAEADIDAALIARFMAPSEKAAIAAERAEAAALARREVAEASLRSLSPDTQAVMAEIETARRVAAAAETRRAETQTIYRELDRRTKPISVFISRKTQRLYVRQGNEPVLEAAVRINDPGRPFGTHVLTVMELEAGQKAARWSAVTLEDPAAKPVLQPVRSRRGEAAPPPTPAAGRTLTSVLDRIEFSEEIRQFVGESLKPGSSLILSDHGISSETGKATDFVILTSEGG